jgi:hypothetical protein
MLWLFSLGWELGAFVPSYVETRAEFAQLSNSSKNVGKFSSYIPLRNSEGSDGHTYIYEEGFLNI